jgi:glycosyltransferase involved in cell wall biosynthesis
MLRTRLGLPAERMVIVSVAALNRHHKRLDYLIEEVAALPAPRPFLILVGEPDEETPALRQLAGERLGAAGHSFRTVPAAEVADLLRASDVFVLASLHEAQGRALIEAASQGLPSIAHDSPITRYALGEYGIFADLSHRGSLTRLLREQAAADPEATRARAQAVHRYVYETFSWDRLRQRYVALFDEVARTGSRSAPGSRVANNTDSSSTGEAVLR